MYLAAPFVELSYLSDKSCSYHVGTHTKVLHTLCPGRSRWGVEYSRFQVTGMIKGFFGFEILDFAIFLGRKILATVFLIA